MLRSTPLSVLLCGATPIMCGHAGNSGTATTRLDCDPQVGPFCMQRQIVQAAQQRACRGRMPKNACARCGHATVPAVPLYLHARSASTSATTSVRSRYASTTSADAGLSMQACMRAHGPRVDTHATCVCMCPANAQQPSKGVAAASTAWCGCVA